MPTFKHDYLPFKRTFKGVIIRGYIISYNLIVTTGDNIFKFYMFCLKTVKYVNQLSYKVLGRL